MLRALCFLGDLMPAYAETAPADRLGALCFPLRLEMQSKHHTAMTPEMRKLTSAMVHFVFEDDFVICELDDSLPVLKHRWKKEPTGKHFRETLLRILDYYKRYAQEYPDLAWLADTQQLGELDQESEKWLADVWDDRLFASDAVKVHAVILGDDLFAEYAMEKFKMEAEKKRDRDVQLGVFIDEEEAYDWIRTR